MKRVSFETAKILKDVGYPQTGEYWYDGSGLCCYSESDLDEIGYIFSPTYFDVMCWLMDTHNIYIFVQKISKDAKSCCHIYQDCKCEYKFFDDWYEAFEWGIEQSIKKL